MPNNVVLIIFVTFLARTVVSQENAGTSIAPSLEECYNTTYISTRDNRLPATITTLIELIRRAEEGNPSVNARELSIQLLHRFRQDGIWRNDKGVDISLGLPYSPRGLEAYKNRVQLRKLTPGNALTFNNDSLTLLQRCSLHSMISSTIEYNERGDESLVCSRISRYTMRIHKRQTEFSERIETTRTRSECPLESGVVYTKWGAVKAGLVIAGIAAGFERINVPSSNGTADNRYGSTITGELSEAAINQGTNDIKIGVSGGWNSTTLPKYYFLQDKEKAYVTDAEIRGGLDGLYLALNIDAWKSRANNLKISQLLDLYYSPRGVFNDTIRACNRKILRTALAPTESLITQTYYFNFLLNEESVALYSPTTAAFLRQSENSVKSFNDHISSLNDLECSSEDTTVERISTDVVIFIDTAWEFKTIQPFLSYILEHIDVNKYESTYYTVINGVTNETIVNKTRSILDFYENYTLTEHQKQTSGFDFDKAILAAEDIYRAKLNNGTDLTGQSTIVLFAPHNTPTSAQNQYAQDRIDTIFKRFLPDLRVLVVGIGSKEDYASYVTNTNNDVFTLNDNADENSLKSVGTSLVVRIQAIPRAVVNPNCGAKFNKEESTTFDVTQYVEPRGVNYHRISPNYYYSGSGNRNLKIKGQGYGTLSVCFSRTESNPRNGTSAECKSIISDEVTYDISDFCNDKSVTSCSPIYLSVEGLTSNFRCTDLMCRFPDSIKYSISLENVGCDSGSQRLIGSLVLSVTILFALLKF